MMMATNAFCVLKQTPSFSAIPKHGQRARLTFLASGAHWSNKSYDAYAVSDVLELLEH